MIKNIYKIGILSMLGLSLLTSCEEDKVVFDNVNGQTMLSFATSSQSIGVGPDEGENVSYITVNATTVSSQDRTFTVDVDPTSTAIAGTEYTIDQASLFIPAGEYVGKIKIVGNFDELTEGENKMIVLKITPNSAFTLDKDVNTISIFRSCPVPVGYFVGDYLLEQVTEQGADGPVLEDGVVREVTVDPTNPKGRVFTSYNFPNFCSTARNQFKFLLNCGQVIVDGANTSNCICSQDAPYTFGPATVNETYDTDSDAVMYISFTNDVTANCGPANQIVYKLTKQ